MDMQLEYSTSVCIPHSTLSVLLNVASAILTYIASLKCAPVHTCVCIMYVYVTLDIFKCVFVCRYVQEVVIVDLINNTSPLGMYEITFSIPTNERALWTIQGRRQDF